MAQQQQDAWGRPIAYDANGRAWAWTGQYWVEPVTQAELGLQMPPGPAPQGTVLQQHVTPRAPSAGAKPVMPNLQDLGGPAQLPWKRIGFYPTSPRHSTNPATGHIVRRYSVRLQATDADFVVGAASIRLAQFTLPVRLVALNGSAFNTSPGNAFPVGVDRRDAFRAQLQYTNGDFLDINATLGSTVVGTSGLPGELGDEGWTFAAASSATFNITPLLDGIDIDIVLVCLEIRGDRDYQPGQAAA